MYVYMYICIYVYMCICICVKSELDMHLEPCIAPDSAAYIQRRPAQRQGSGGRNQYSGANDPKRGAIAFGLGGLHLVWLDPLFHSFDLHQLGTVSLTLWLGATIFQLGTDHPLPVWEGVPPLSHW